MAYFNRDKYSGRDRDFGKKRFNDRGADGRPKMFSATCSRCGNACEVPFRPNGSKPVLCNTCFRNNRATETRNFDSNMRGGDYHEKNKFEKNREQNHYNEQFASLNTKLDKIINMLHATSTLQASELNLTRPEPVAKAVEEVTAEPTIFVKAPLPQVITEVPEKKAMTTAKKKAPTKKK